MDILKKFKPSHYTDFLSSADKYISKHKNVGTWVRFMSLPDLLVWIETLENTKKDNPIYFEENAKFVTVIIRLFILELDVEERSVELKNKEIAKLIKRFDKIIKSEYAYRTNLIKERFDYTLLKDIKKEG